MNNGNEPINPTGYNQTGVGLTKREYFAGLFLQGMLTNPNRDLVYNDMNDKVKDCIAHADALLEGLKK